MGKTQCFMLVCQLYIFMTQSMEAINVDIYIYIYIRIYRHTWYLPKFMRWIFILVSECLSNLRVSVLFLIQSLQAVMTIILVHVLSNNYMILVYIYCWMWSKSTLYICCSHLLDIRGTQHIIIMHAHVHQTSVRDQSFIHSYSSPLTTPIVASIE